jgi:hypothetical protein
MKNIAKNTLILSFSTFMLAACGGGGGTSDSATPSSDSTVQASPSFGDCMTLAPGVKYEMTNGRKYSNELEDFNGQKLLGSVELRADGTRFGTLFYKVEGGFVHMLGINDYGNFGAPSSTSVYSDSARFASDLKPGQTVQYSYNVTQTYVNPPLAPSTKTETDVFTFTGFETLTLGGRKFENACKITTASHNAGNTFVTWYAKGFGLIQAEEYDAQAVKLPGNSFALVRVVAAP